MSCRNSTVIGMVALAWGTTAFAASHELQRGRLKARRDATAVRSAPIRPDVERTAKGSPLGIARVRLDPPPPGERKNAAILKFRMSNRSSSTLADIVFEVSIVEERRRGHLDRPRRVLAGPFAITGTIVLDPGYTADYEILLRNISAPCRCAANVRVLSFRSMTVGRNPEANANNTSRGALDASGIGGSTQLRPLPTAHPCPELPSRLSYPGITRDQRSSDLRPGAENRHADRARPLADYRGL
jgi:hypothetical protein